MFLVLSKTVIPPYSTTPLLEIDVSCVRYQLLSVPYIKHNLLCFCGEATLVYKEPHFALFRVYQHHKCDKITDGEWHLQLIVLVLAIGSVYGH